MHQSSMFGFVVVRRNLPAEVFFNYDAESFQPAYGLL